MRVQDIQERIKSGPSLTRSGSLVPDLCSYDIFTVMSTLADIKAAIDSLPSEQKEELHPGKNPDRAEIEWKFTDDQGRAWHGSGVAETSAAEKGKFNLKLQLARAR